MFNLTIVSQNSKDIDIIKLIPYGKIDTITDNQTIPIEYTNLLLNVHSSTVTFTQNNLWDNINSINSKAIFIFLSVLIILIAFLGIKVVKKWAK